MTFRWAHGTGHAWASIAACAVCFQVEPGATSSGVHAAVITLMAITGAVLGGVLLFLRRTRLLSESAPAAGRGLQATGQGTTPSGDSDSASAEACGRHVAGREAAPEHETNGAVAARSPWPAADRRSEKGAR